MSEIVIEIKNLKSYFYLDVGVLKAVDGISLKIPAGKTVGVMGESGCGKSAVAQSILRILPKPGKIVSGSIMMKSRKDDSYIDLCEKEANDPGIRAVRGKEISMIFQEPMTSFSPVHTIGNQIIEAIKYHDTRDDKLAREIALSMLNKVGISNPGQRIDEYPHQLSGGLRQRAMIAMALSCKPQLLIADEPTTALDVTIQAQILDLMESLQEELGMSILFITHDLGVIAERSQQVAVMYLGRVVEFTDTRTLFKNPMHPYTNCLLKSVPRLGMKTNVKLDTIKGTVPTPLNLPYQCGFYGRCPEAIEGTCDRAIPALVETEEGHNVRCFKYSGEKEQG